MSKNYESASDLIMKQYYPDKYNVDNKEPKVVFQSDGRIESLDEFGNPFVVKRGIKKSLTDVFVINGVIFNPVKKSKLLKATKSGLFSHYSDGKNVISVPDSDKVKSTASLSLFSALSKEIKKGHTILFYSKHLKQLDNITFRINFSDYPWKNDILSLWIKEIIKLFSVINSVENTSTVLNNQNMIALVTIFKANIHENMNTYRLNQKTQGVSDKVLDEEYIKKLVGYLLDIKTNEMVNIVQKSRISGSIAFTNELEFGLDKIINALIPVNSTKDEPKFGHTHTRMVVNNETFLYPEFSLTEKDIKYFN